MSPASRTLGALLLCLMAGAPASGASSRAGTALDAYVRAPDPAYGYRPVSVLEGDGYRAHVLEMTSQSWRRADEVDRTLWTHWLTVIVPATVRHRTALLYIGGGRNGGPPPSEVRPDLAHAAVATGSVAVHLQQVPNQPLTFAGESEARREDALIARSWDLFLRTGDPTWLPRLPMTKSVVRAMDTVVDFAARPEAGGHPIESFVVAGSSKRGWTAWTTAAVDARVIAVVPIVIDLLNLEASFRNHWRSYGSWSPAIGEYVEVGIPRWLGTEEFRALERIEDPHSYRKRLTLPKLILNAAGDAFFVPDSSRFYFDDLSGEKHLRYVPNADHSMDGSDALDTLLAFYRAILEGDPRPRMTWRFELASSIRVRTDPARPPGEVRLWRATNRDARDFRLDTLGTRWESSALTSIGRGIYVATVEEPARGWTAFFVEATYPGRGPEPLKLTTAVRIVPDTLPFPPPGPEPRGQ